MKKYLSINGNDYEVIKFDSNRGQSMYDAFNNSEIIRTLAYCYSRPSIYKIRAYEKCCKIAYDLDAHGTITSYNTFSFIYMFMAQYNEHIHLFVITKDNKYIVM